MADRSSKISSKIPPIPPHAATLRKPVPPKAAADGFPVVAVGASAGGLNALQKFIAAVPVDCEMAFILIQHLDPTHSSMMPDLLASHTALPVQQAADGMRVERNHVYTMPPGAYLAIRGGALELTSPVENRGVRLPFDFFLRSLAQDLGERAICVVLSGAGTDGSLGLRSVKEHNGLVVVQDPVEAEHDGMPRSAILTEAVDRILPVGEIAATLVAYGRGRRVEKLRDRDPGEDDGCEDLEEIVTLLRTRTAHDFRLYKTGTLARRVHRRRVMSGVPDNARYVDLLKQDSRELELLAKDLLINVTSFFRDPAVFDFLAERTIPDLLRRHGPDEPIRVWVAGCSTGEEPYSIAMLVFEEMARMGLQNKLQVFASDVDADAIVAAREGLYPESIASDVSPERLERFFIKEDHHYRVIPNLRAAVIFAVHDILADPPFARLDLISCRNLLIYLTVEAQDRILRLFHFSLRDGGKLLLGSSETVGKLSHRYRAVSKSQRVYARVGYLRPGEVDFPVKPGGRAGLRGIQEPAKPSSAARLGELARSALLEVYAPPSALINERHEVLFYLGETDRYLRVTPGEPSRDLLLMAREGLRSKLRIALREAAQQKLRVVVNARMTREGATMAVGLSVQPIQGDDETLFLVSFADQPPARHPSAGKKPNEDDPARVSEVERELETTRAELQSAVHELEVWSDEQRAINEEALSVNEESQATNEELMTSKEELQSLNEELAALNNQLQEALDGQRDAANDLQNILYSADVATLFLDSALNIRFFTPAAKAHFRIIATDIGRPLADLTPRTPDGTLLAEARDVIARSAPTRSEIEGSQGRWYVRRIMPYRTLDGRVEGVVVTFVDVSDLKAAERRLQ